MEVIKTDVAVIGAGGAGLRAAIAVAETDPKLTIALISKVYPMRSHTVAAEGGSAGVIKDNDSLDHHFNDTVSGGDWLTDQDAVEYFIKDAPRQLLQMEHWGCPWSREPDGKVSVRPFGGMAIERTWYAADKTGFHMLHTLFQTSLKFPSIKRYDEFFAVELIVEDGHCHGAIAMEMRTGELKMFVAKAVIIATGGAGKVFPFTTNGAIKTGDGMHIAYRAGVPLKDMEFVQYHPTGLPATGILITEAARGEGGLLLNKDGYRYLQDYGLGPPDPSPRKKAMELGPRDRLSQAFWQESKKGRTIQTPHGDAVLLDIRHLGEKKINRQLPFVRELAHLYGGVDPVYEPIPVRPVVHYMMGGIHTNLAAETPVKGLYAAGECACVSINGANRLGSNSLTELLVFGDLAGQNAAKFARGGARDIKDATLNARASDTEARVYGYLKSTGGKEKVATLRTEMTQTMEEGAGIYREEKSLQATVQKLQEIEERFGKVMVEDSSKTFNTGLLSILEMRAMIDIARSVACSALARKESRGAHQRLDFTSRDDQNFLKHSMASFSGKDNPKIGYLDVVITKSKPAERVYGGAAKK